VKPFPKFLILTNKQKVACVFACCQIWFLQISISFRARTQDLEEQQPGVEGELRRLINKPGKNEARLTRAMYCKYYSSGLINVKL